MPGTDLHHRVPVRTADWVHDGTEPDTAGYHPAATPLPGTDLPEDLSPEELQAISGLLDGRPLRTEVYGDDGTVLATVPYLVTEHRYAVRRAQDGTRLVHPLETVTTHVERGVREPDPRVTHDLVLTVDDAGTITECARIGYPRVIPKQPGQETLHATLTRHVLSDGDTVPRVPVETFEYEVTGLTPPLPGGRFTVEELREAVASDTAAPPASKANPDRVRLRLIARTRILYWDDDLTGPLPLGQPGSGAIVHHTRRLAFTPELLARIYGDRVDNALLDAAGYLCDADGYWIAAQATEAASEEAVDQAPAAVLHRDPLDRVIRVEHPDGAVSEVDHHAWRRETWDECDTVLTSRWYAERGGPDPMSDEPDDPATRAAWLAAHHADTPATTHLDPLGRAIIEVADADGLDQFASHSQLDGLGHVRAVTDARGMLTMRRDVDLLGRELRVTTSDAGTEVTFPDTTGRPVRTWDDAGNVVCRNYNSATRELQVHNGATGYLAELSIPGDVPVAFDEAGMRRTEHHGDGAVSVVRRLARTPETPTDWAPLHGLNADEVEPAAARLLDPTPLVLSTVYDGSVTRTRFPDGTELAYLHGHGGLTAVTATLADGRTVPVITRIDRDLHGRPVLIAYGDGTSVARVYDPMGALVADGETRYTYDALGRLVRAESPDGTLCRSDDPVGNTLSTVHISTGRPPRIVRFHHAEDPDTGEPVSNRLVAHSNDRDPEGVFSALFEYDVRGNVTELPHLPGAVLSWDHANRLRHIDFGDGRQAHYAYDEDGARVRSIIRRGAEAVEERVHIGAWTRRSTALGESVHIDLVDGDHHLGGLCLPDGTISHGGPPPDPETGFLHRNGRCLAPWLGRWLSPAYAYTGPVNPGHRPVDTP